MSNFLLRSQQIVAQNGTAGTGGAGFCLDNFILMGKVTSLVFLFSVAVLLYHTIKMYSINYAHHNILEQFKKGNQNNPSRNLTVQASMCTIYLVCPHGLCFLSIGYFHDCP